MPALNSLFQNTASQLDLGQSMLAGTQSGIALGQAFRQQDAAMLAAQEAHRAERMAAFEMSVKAARAVGEAQDREFQRSQMELNNAVARSQIQFNQDQLQFRRDEFEARLPLERRRVEVQEDQFELERDQARRKQRIQDRFIGDLPGGDGGIDTPLFGEDSSGGDVDQAVFEGELTTFSHLGDLRDPEDSGIGMNNNSTADVPGVSMNQKMFAKRFPGESKDSIMRNFEVDILDASGNYLGTLPIVDRGPSDAVIERAGGPVLDVTAAGIKALGGDLKTSGKNIIGHSLTGKHTFRVRRKTAEGAPSDAQIAGALGPPPERPAPTPPVTDQRLPSGAAPKTADQLDPRSTIEARNIIANREGAVVEIDQMIESKQRALQTIAEKKQRAERRADRTAQFLEVPFINSVDIENLTDTEALVLEEINVLEKQRVKAHQEALMAQAIIDQQAIAQGTGMSTGDVEKLSNKMEQYETAGVMIEKLDELSDDEFLAITENLKSFTRRLEDLPGGEFFLGAFNLHTSPIKSEFLALRSSLLNVVLKERSGAAVTENEMERFLMEIGDPSRMSRDHFEAATRAWAGRIQRGYEREVQGYLEQNIFVSPSLNPFNESPRLQVDPSNVRTPRDPASTGPRDGQLKTANGKTYRFNAAENTWDLLQ